MDSHSSCEAVRPLLFAVIEGATTESESSMVTAHLAECPECRREMERERVLTRRLRAKPPVRRSRSTGRVFAIAAAVLATVLVGRLWWAPPTVSHRGTIVASSLGFGLDWHPDPVSRLREANHVSLEMGARVAIDLEDVGSITATGPVTFGLDRASDHWKVTVLDGEVVARVLAGESLRYASRRGAREVDSGEWTLSALGAERAAQDSTVALLAKAHRVFQEEPDKAISERLFRAVIAREDCTPSQRRTSMFFIWCAQQHQGKHAEAVTTIDEWLAAFPEDPKVPRVRLHRGLNLAMQGRVAEAHTDWQDLLASRPDEKISASVRELMRRFPVASGRGSFNPEPIEGWARRCASEIPWQLDTKSAAERSETSERPLLVYVRCVHDLRGLVAAQSSLAADGVSLRDSGYAKDLLFRAGALADPRNSALIRDRFDSLLLTYDFSSHGKGVSDANWRSPRRDGERGDIFDPEVGASEPGSLTLSGASSLMQAIVKPVHQSGDEFRLSAKARSVGDGRASVRVYWTARGHDQVRGESAVLGPNSDWNELTYVVRPDAPLINVLVMPSYRGSGRVWFDDIELVHYRDGAPVSRNLLHNGECADTGDGSDPLAAFGLRAKDIVTPALLVVEGGKVVRCMHRIGVVSPDHVHRWLRTALGLGVDAAPISAALQAGCAALRDGAWGIAADSLAEVAAEPEHPSRAEAAFLRGLALHRAGRFGEAESQWLAVAGPTPSGRRAAACLVAGPYLPQAISLREWSAASRDDSTEVAPGQEFDPGRSIDVLLDLQSGDGAFVDHLARGRANRLVSHWSVAYTAIAGDALRRWRDRVAVERRARVDHAVERLDGFLKDASHQPAKQVDAFNDPYALEYLVEIGATAAAQRFVARIAGAQQRDGSWTVYGPQRPTSFNTAQNLLALMRARVAGLSVDDAVIAAGTDALASMRGKDGRISYAPLPGFRWMTTPVGGIAREPLCERSLLDGEHGSDELLANALRRFLEHHPTLRAPTKHYSSDFNRAGHGAYFFYYAHRNAVDAAARTDAELRKRVFSAVADAVLSSREADGSFVDHALYGRVYGTAMALSILARVLPR